ncbi:MAG: DUF4347 domain-containing protein, partial [Thermodesulfobacteriota bacterium]
GAVAEVATMLSADEGDAADGRPEDIGPILRPGEGSDPLNVVLIADNLPDLQTLQAAAEAESHAIFTYDAGRDEMAEVLTDVTDFAEETGRKVGSLTILSHGGSGFFHLGNEMVTADSLEDSAETWGSLQDHMAQNGQIHLYGCNVASDGGSGQALLDGLADATGASVFASDDMTGKEGDWTLEAASGKDAGDADSPMDGKILAGFQGSLTTSIPSAITTQEDEPGSFGVFIFGPDEDANSRVAGDVTLTNFGPDALLNNAQIFYEGFVTDRPREIDGVLVQEYHRWTVDYDPVQDAFGPDGEIDFRVEQNGTFQNNFTTDITILPVNDPPIAEDDEFTTPEDQPISGTLEGSDPVEGDPVTFEILDGPTNGVITDLDPDTGF